MGAGQRRGAGGDFLQNLDRGGDRESPNCGNCFRAVGWKFRSSGKTRPLGQGGMSSGAFSEVAAPSSENSQEAGKRAALPREEAARPEPCGLSLPLSSTTSSPGCVSPSRICGELYLYAVQSVTITLREVAELLRECANPSSLRRPSGSDGTRSYISCTKGLRIKPTHLPDSNELCLAGLLLLAC